VLGGDAPFGDPDWSPDGTQIVIAANDKVTIVRAADGTKVRDIQLPAHTTVSDAAWSPDGAWISFTASATAGSGQVMSNVDKVHPDGSGLVQVTDNHDLTGSASWSPDGSHFVFRRRMAAADGTTSSQVRTMTADGGDQRRLVTQPTGIGQLAWS